MFFNCRWSPTGSGEQRETGKVKDMSGMFYNATKFTRKIGGCGLELGDAVCTGCFSLRQVLIRTFWSGIPGK